jgi:hypothetical protein
VVNGQYQPAQWILDANKAKVTAREGMSTRSPDLKLMRGAVVTVRVVDIATGKALPQVQFYCTSWRDNVSQNSSYGFMTDANGQSTFRFVPGRARISLRLAPGKNKNVIESNNVLYKVPSRSGRVVLNQRDPDSTSSVLVNLAERQPNNVVFRAQRYNAAKVSPALRTQPVNLSSPEETVRSFVNAIASGDDERAAACVEGGLPLLNPRLIISDSTSVSHVLNTQIKQQGDKATIRVKTRLKQWLSEGESTYREEVANLRLIRRNGAWKFARPFLKYSQNDPTVFQDHINRLAPAYREKLQQWAAKRGTATITGRVFYEDGRPAANVQGLAFGGSIFSVVQNFGGWRYSDQDNLPTHAQSLTRRLFITDKNGAFRLTGLTTLRYSIGFKQA